jgi:hypothetical protein
VNPTPGRPGMRSLMRDTIELAGAPNRPVVRWHQNCTECGQQFTTEIPHQKICGSERCKAARKRTLKERAK